MSNEQDNPLELPEPSITQEAIQSSVPRSFSEFVQACVQFVRKPNYALPHSYSGWEAFKILAFALLLDYLLMFLSIVLISLVVGTDLVEQNHQLRDMIESHSPLFIFVFVAVLAPLLEETIFRLFLRFSTLHLLLSLLFAAFFFIPRTSGWFFWAVLAVFLFVFFGLVMLYLNTQEAIQNLENFWVRHFSKLYYFSVFSFGLVHIFNYSLPLWKAVLLSPILVLPQVLLGFILGYLRIKYHFGFALALHAIHNAILIIPTLLFKDLIIGS